MPSKVEKKIILDVQTKNADKVKKLQESVVKTMEAIEKLQGHYDKKSKEQLAIQKKQLELYRIELSYHRDLGIQIDRNTAKYRQQTSEILRAQKAEAKRMERQIGGQTFWSQAPGLSAIWNRYKPSSVLTGQLSRWQERAQSAFGRRQELNARISTIGGELAGWRTKLKNADEGSAEAQEAEFAIRNLTSERKRLYKDRKGARAEEASAMKSAVGTTAALMTINTAAKIGKMLFTGIKDTFAAVSGISFDIRGNFKDVLSEVSKITDMYHGMATYATGSSLIMNASARQTQLQYGLTSGQAFAFDRVRQTLGINSDEDLMYMNRSQHAVFQKMMSQQEAWYSKLESSGVLQNIQQMQLDFSMFKQEMAMDIMSWFAENKMMITNIMKAGLNVMKALLQAIGTVITFFGGSMGSSYGAGSSLLSDTVAAANNTSINKTVNMNMTNNATGVLSDQDALQTFMQQAMETAVRKTINEIQ